MYTWSMFNVQPQSWALVPLNFEYSPKDSRHSQTSIQYNVYIIMYNHPEVDRIWRFQTCSFVAEDFLKCP